MRLHDYTFRPAHFEWFRGYDPAIRWQVMSDLTDEAPGAIAAERERVATEGWVDSALHERGSGWKFRRQRGRSLELEHVCLRAQQSAGLRLSKTISRSVLPYSPLTRPPRLARLVALAHLANISSARIGQIVAFGIFPTSRPRHLCSVKPRKIEARKVHPIKLQKFSKPLWP